MRTDNLDYKPPRSNCRIAFLTEVSMTVSPDLFAGAVCASAIPAVVDVLLPLRRLPFRRQIPCVIRYTYEADLAVTMCNF